MSEQFTTANQAALMSHRVRTGKHRCAAGMAGAHPGLQDRILLKYTRIENGHEARKKTFVFFYYVQKSSKLLVCLFPYWDIMKCLNTSMLIAVFEIVQQF